MSHERWHVVEKIQVEVAAAAALAFMYFVGWRLFRPHDVDQVLVFLPIGAIGSLLVFAVVVWLLAAVVAVLTVSSRPEGALLALLVGVAGGSIHTGPMRFLVNRFHDSMAGLMASLVGDVLILTVIFVVAAAVIALVRWGLHRVAPAWMHPARQTDPIAVAMQGPTNGRRAVRAAAAWLFSRADTTLSTSAKRSDRPKGKGRTQGAGEAAFAIAASFALTLLAGLVLMMITLHATGSTARGQILFSLAVSFLLAAWAVSSFIPAGFSAPCLLAPLVLAIAVYLRTSTVLPMPPLTWAHIGMFANILPMDWLSAGCGGAVGGYWLSCRWHEAKAAERAQAT